MPVLTKVAVYTRVSTEDQAREGFSIDAQEERLKAYCEAQGWEIFKHYSDRGHSGRNTNRPGYQQMMEDMDKWNMLLVLKMDRIHRNSKNFMMMMEELEIQGKKFSSMQESLDTSSAVGRFVVDIIQRIAQLESEQIGERTYMGMAEKAESGDGILGFSPPFGYDYEEGELSIIEEQAAAVEEVYTMYLDGYSMSDIAHHLNHMGVTTKRGNSWSTWSISYILHNPIYSGFVRWDGIIFPNDHEAVVSPSTFNEVQRKIAENTRGPSKKLVELPLTSEEN